MSVISRLSLRRKSSGRNKRWHKIVKSFWVFFFSIILVCSEFKITHLSLHVLNISKDNKCMGAGGLQVCCGTLQLLNFYIIYYTNDVTHISLCVTMYLNFYLYGEHVVMPNPKCKVIVKNKFAKIYPSNQSLISTRIYFSPVYSYYICMYLQVI